MNVNEISELYSSDAIAEIEVSELSKSQAYLLTGNKGLKQNEIVVIKPQLIVKDSFDLGEGRKSKLTLCVIAQITDKNGKVREAKMSLNQLVLRTYGTELKQFGVKDYPFHETSDITITTKVDDDAKTVMLIDEIKFKVVKIEKHYVSLYDEKTAKSQVDETGLLLVLKAKDQPIFKTIK